MRVNYSLTSKVKLNTKCGTGSNATSVDWKVTGVKTQQDGIPEEERPENSGIVALLNLAIAQLSSRDEEPLFAVGRAYGILRFTLTHTLRLSEDNVIFEKAMLEGIELANVYSAHFGQKVANRYWITLHEGNPREGSPSLLSERYPVYMIDITATGSELVNVSDVDIDISQIGAKALKFVGVWDEEDNGNIVDVGEFQVALDLDGRTELCFSAGGIRTSVKDET